MPWDCCSFLCLLTDRRRYCEILWRRRLLITNDERKAKRRFLNLMRGFDSEDLRILRRAIESGGHDIKQCAPGPPMDLVEETDENEDDLLIAHQPIAAAGCSSTIMSSRPRHSINRLERDRLLFQRKKFPELSQAPPPQPSPGGFLPPPPPPLAAAYPEYVAQYRKNSTSHRRNSSIVFNRRNTYLSGDADFGAENEDGDYCVHQHKPSTSQTFDDDGSADRNSNEDLGLIPQIDRPMSMPYLCCKMWRWKDLQVDAALHRLDPMPWCRFGRVTINNATVSCCNPYHYGLWIRPEHSPSLSSQEIADANNQHLSGIIANGGGHLMGDYSGLNDIRIAMDGVLPSSAAVIGGGDGDVAGHTAIGHVRSVFKSIEQHIKKGGGSTAAAAPLDADLPPLAPPPPVPEDELAFMQNTLSNHFDATQPPTILQPQPYAWGRMARWEKKQRIGDVVALFGQFAAVGQLAGTVFDGQDIKTTWDIENEVSFSLIRQMEKESFEDIWLYNSGEKPLFICVSKSLSTSARSDAIRRLSPGYCIRVHRSHTSGDPAVTTGPGVEFTTTLSGSAPRNHVAPKDVADIALQRQQAQPTALPSSISFLTISVGVGWGINYQRLYVTDVPCRYEVIFT